MPTYLVWRLYNQQLHYAGEDIMKAIEIAKANNVLSVDVWHDGKQIGNINLYTG